MTSTDTIKDMPIAVGSPAPDFTLKTMTPDGLKDVTLSDHFGSKNTVLLFVPGAFTGVCTQQFCDMTGGLAEYEGMDAAVYGISVDSPFAQEGWAKAKGIGIPLLSDYARTVIKAYDVELPDFAGLGAAAAKRAVVVLDKDGVVRYVQVTPTPGDLPNMDEVKSALSAL